MGLGNTLCKLLLPMTLAASATFAQAHEVEDDAGHAHIEIDVRGGDETVTVTVDGAAVDASQPVALSADVHEIGIDATCWQAEPVRVAVIEGRDERVKLYVKPLLREVKVTARGPAGQLNGAKVVVDGVEVGVTPGTFEVSVCAQKLEVSAHSLAAWSAPLRHGVKEISANLSSSRRDRHGIPIVGTGGGSLFKGALKISYPRDAKRKRIEGVVRVRILIDEKGRPIARSDDRCKPIYEAEATGHKTWHAKSCAYGEGPPELVEGALKDWLKAGFRPYHDPEDDVATPAWITGKTTYRL